VTVGENPDPYLILGVPATANRAEIQHAYRARLRAHHPDTRSSPTSHTADEQLLAVLEAYALLRDPARKAEYDRAVTHAADTGPGNPVSRPPPDHRAVGRIAVTITYHDDGPVVPPLSSPPFRAGPVRHHR
jgi:DnaJ-class molecular chaperone